MKSIIVLYPIQNYVDILMRLEESLQIKEKYVSIYQRLLWQRYHDFQLVYIIFSQNRDSEKPDISRLWQGIIIREKDIIGACGVNFEDHCQEKLYPDPDRIISFCPCPIEKLIVTGFHFSDCVDRVAGYAYGQGIDVMVDEDLTELFFGKIRNRMGKPSLECIPLSREESIKRCRTEFMRAAPFLLELIREKRKNKPWLAKI